MHEDSIKSILKSNLWKNITRNSAFTKDCIVPTYRDNDRAFLSLWVFFHRKIPDEKLRTYLEEGKKLAVGEQLDNNDIIEEYGMKAIVFS